VRSRSAPGGAAGYGLWASQAGSGIGVYSTSPAGIGVEGLHSSSTGALPGVEGMTASTAGSAAGIYGLVKSSSPGAYSAGVYGQNNDTGDNGIGVYGSQAGSGWGMFGTTPAGVGVIGKSASGYGVYGHHTASSGTLPGVQGVTDSPAGAGVRAVNTAGGPGLAAVVNNNSIPPLTVNSTAEVAGLNADLFDGLDSNGLWKLGGNAPASTGILGTTTNEPLELKVNGQRALRLEPNATSPSVVGGYSGNMVQASAPGATIAGGGSSGFENVVTDNFGAVGGGNNNTAGFDGTVGGGGSNSASSLGSTIAGGFVNSASAIYSAVGGGEHNTASGTESTVPGGEGNTASGADGFAAGQNADASDANSFVWNDGNYTSPIPSQGADSFTAHATGGFNLWTNSSGNPTGCGIVSGGGTWVCSSSRSVKDDFSLVDRAQILRRLARVPITTWHYKTEKAGVRHIGPMAQDFARAFHFGQGTTGIAMVDADGISLAAIQGLYRQNQALNGKVVGLQRRNRILTNALASQDARLARLERAVAKLRTSPEH
jgi:Chaperone of endosialidase